MPGLDGLWIELRAVVRLLIDPDMRTATPWNMRRKAGQDNTYS
jgi:hypothetical protein